MRMTSAPMSDRSMPQKGPGPMPANSTMRTPFSGPCPKEILPCHHREDSDEAAVAPAVGDGRPGSSRLNPRELRRQRRLVVLLQALLDLGLLQMPGYEGSPAE